MQQMPNTQSSQTLQEHYAECYLLLAKLALAKREQNTEYGISLIEEALAYLVDHCCFCGEASDLTTLKNGVVPVIVCRDCYTSPLNLNVACRTLRDPAIKAMAAYAREDAEMAFSLSSNASIGFKLHVVK